MAGEYGLPKQPPKFQRLLFFPEETGQHQVTVTSDSPNVLRNRRPATGARSAEGTCQHGRQGVRLTEGLGVAGTITATPSFLRRSRETHVQVSVAEGAL